MWYLIQKYITGQCTEEELRRMEEWMSHNQANRQLVEELQQIWELAPDEKFEVNAHEALQRLKYKQHKKKTSSADHSYKIQHETSLDNYSRHKRVSFLWKNLLRVAAVILIAIPVGWYVSTRLMESDKLVAVHSMAMQKVETPRGKKAEITFSDGSKVILNAATTLKYPKEFTGSERKIYLNGEAFFEVVHNSKIPFIVETDKAQIRDIGTKFNVRAWKNDKMAEVTVRDGEVSVHANHSSSNQQNVILKKGQYTVISPGKTLDVRKANYQNNLLWLSGGLNFDDVPFSEVIKQVGRRFDVNFVVTDKALLDIPYTGKFIKADLPKVLSVLSVSMDITFLRKKGLIIIRNRRANKN